MGEKDSKGEIESKFSQGLLSDLTDTDFRDCKDLAAKTARNWCKHLLHRDLESFHSSYRKSCQLSLSFSSLDCFSVPLSAGAKIMFCGTHAVNYRQQVPPG